MQKTLVMPLSPPHNVRPRTLPTVCVRALGPGCCSRYPPTRRLTRRARALLHHVQAVQQVAVGPPTRQHQFTSCTGVLRRVQQQQQQQQQQQRCGCVPGLGT
jgi:hypothetical protein